jgi:hypothetical protein
MQNNRAYEILLEARQKAAAASLFSAMLWMLSAVLVLMVFSQAAEPGNDWTFVLSASAIAFIVWQRHYVSTRLRTSLNASEPIQVIACSEMAGKLAARDWRNRLFDRRDPEHSQPLLQAFGQRYGQHSLFVNLLAPREPAWLTWFQFGFFCIAVAASLTLQILYSSWPASAIPGLLIMHQLSLDSQSGGQLYGFLLRMLDS